MKLQQLINKTKQGKFMCRDSFLFPKDSYITLGTGCKYYICNIKNKSVKLYNLTLSDLEANDWREFSSN